jgi:hypothetical protein
MFNEIPKLSTSSDYPRWAQTVSAYLGVQKAIKVITKTAPVLEKAKDGTSNQEAIDAWEELEHIARGVIILTPPSPRP